MKPKNCRFMAFVNGDDVTLTLKPGQSLHHYQRGSTDEGWSSSAESWTLSSDGRLLKRENESDGRDCDGRLQRYSTSYADSNPATFHAGYDPYKDRPAMFPYWTEGQSYQRDHFAEAMNY